MADGGVTGDFAKLADLERRFALVASGSVHQGLKTAVATEVVTQVRLGFLASRDPYGTAWKPLKVRRGQPLVKTWRLYNSIKSRVTNDGFVYSAKTPYAAYHQGGTSRIPARPFLPTRELPPAWGEAFARTASDFFRRKTRF